MILFLNSGNRLVDVNFDTLRKKLERFRSSKLENVIGGHSHVISTIHLLFGTEKFFSCIFSVEQYSPSESKFENLFGIPKEILNEYPVMRRAMEKVAAARLSSLGKHMNCKLSQTFK